MGGSRRIARGAVAVCVVASVMVFGFVVAPPASAATITLADLTGPLAPVDLANTLAGSGVTVSNVTFAGEEQAAGTFSGGGTGAGAIIGFESGVVLSSGSVLDAAGPNDSDSTTVSLGTPGDADLDPLDPSGTPTHDSTVLEFDFTPNASNVSFLYVFASEEYNEYVNSSVNDTFGFFVTAAGSSTKVNCAVVPDGPDDGTDPDPVSINTINNGNPFGSDPKSNPALYRNNDLDDGGTIDAEPDGFTTVLTCSASVVANQPNHLKLAIADRGDSALDSWVFLAQDSLTTAEICNNGIDDDGDTLVDAADPDCAAAPNPAPIVSAGGPYGGVEGASVSVDGTVTNQPDTDTVTTTWSATPDAGVDAGASCSFGNPAAVDTTVSCTDDGTWQLSLTATDGVNPPVVANATLTLSNANPAVVIASPADLSQHSLASPVSVAASFTDAGANDSHTCSISWGDGATAPGTVSAGSCSGSHTYSAIGVPTIVVTVTDDDGGSGSAEVSVVVSDAATTKVTGGGFVIDDGRTSFGFVAGPDGGLAGQIQVRAPGKHRFHGSTVTSLVVSSNTATWSGTGRWDGIDGYTFTVAVVDNRNGGGKKGTPDTISVTIRDAGGSIVHTASGPLQGGNLTVH